MQQGSHFEDAHMGSASMVDTDEWDEQPHARTRKTGPIEQRVEAPVSTAQATAEAEEPNQEPLPQEESEMSRHDSSKVGEPSRKQASAAEANPDSDEEAKSEPSTKEPSEEDILNMHESMARVDSTLALQERQHRFETMWRHHDTQAIAKALDEGELDANITDTHGRSALQLAAAANDVDVLKVLLAAKADPNRISPSREEETMLRIVADPAKASTQPMAATTVTPLIAASALNHTEAVKLLLQHGADANLQVGQLKRTALHFAAKAGAIDVVDVLLVQGVANPSIRDLNNLLPVGCCKANDMELQGTLHFAALIHNRLRELEDENAELRLALLEQTRQAERPSVREVEERSSQTSSSPSQSATVSATAPPVREAIVHAEESDESEGVGIRRTTHESDITSDSSDVVDKSGAQERRVSARRPLPEPSLPAKKKRFAKIRRKLSLAFRRR
ncbi:MAG: hypothetical protein MHM6MM_005276 [Cercozoa sp. M6MM]